MVLWNTRMATAILAQGNSLELERAASTYCARTSSSYMHTEAIPEETPEDIASRVTFEDLDHLDALVALDRQGASVSTQAEGLWSCWGLLEERDTQDRPSHSKTEDRLVCYRPRAD